MEVKFMEEAVALSIHGMENNEGGPFGAVVVKNGVVVGKGNNKVTSTNDPTAHAEVVAIRDACKNLGTFQLDDCELYTSCEPCPMCLGAIYWARPKVVYYGCTKVDAANIGFDDDFIYQEIKIEKKNRSIPFVQSGRREAIKAFEHWSLKLDRKEY